MIYRFLVLILSIFLISSCYAIESITMKGYTFPIHPSWKNIVIRHDDVINESGFVARLGGSNKFFSVNVLSDKNNSITLDDGTDLSMVSILLDKLTESLDEKHKDSVIYNSLVKSLPGTDLVKNGNISIHVYQKDIIAGSYKAYIFIKRTDSIIEIDAHMQRQKFINYLKTIKHYSTKEM